ncbi:MAG: hypothetical protein KF773_38890 [Deltaproteobacteria bacterium]|nr:hypothetical protein [Deltaproteobacteria bacterium]MCW5806871.1 hypothetical protein [Deltaproteobacteria bacterium]
MRCLALVASALVALSACSPDTPQAYPSYQDCFDDHALVKQDPVVDSIVTCCLDHEIAGVVPVCKDTQADCINYLTANLFQTSADTVQVRDACTLYINKLTMPPSDE